MSTYAIGDIQGSYYPLLRLLEKIQFDPASDKLWLAGDLVNRGPNSLEVMRFLYSIRSSVISVLGNHDLHLLAIARGYRKLNTHDSIAQLLEADDCSLLLDWLRHCKILHHDPELKFTMVHAGIPPQWDLIRACAHARELEAVLHSNQYEEFLANMYGNEPAIWKHKLIGYDRLRIITNYFTRMRFCTAEGELELETKTAAVDAPVGFAPWYSHNNRKTRDDKIIFGHWAALEGRANTPNVYALDTGCAWGGALTAMRLEDEVFFHCDCSAG